MDLYSTSGRFHTHTSPLRRRDKESAGLFSPRNVLISGGKITALSKCKFRKIWDSSKFVDIKGRLINVKMQIFTVQCEVSMLIAKSGQSELSGHHS